MRFRLEEGSRVPRGWGLAWRDWTDDTAVVLPIQLNIIAGLARRGWLWLRNPWRDQKTAGERRCFEIGYARGEITGRTMERYGSFGPLPGSPMDKTVRREGVEQ